VPAEAEGVEDAFGGGARPDDGNVVRHARLDAGPGADDLGAAHNGKKVPDRLGAESEAAKIELGRVGVAVERALVAAADQHRAVGELLEGERARGRPNHRLDEGRQAIADHQHEGGGNDRRAFAERGGDTIGPGAGAIDDGGGCMARAVRSIDAPACALAAQPGDARPLGEARAGTRSGPAERHGGAKGIGGAVGPADDAAEAMIGNRRQHRAELVPVDEFLVVEAEGTHFLDARLQRDQLGLALGHLDLAVCIEAAIVVDEVLDAVPQLHRSGGERDLGRMAAESPHAAGIDPRGVAPGIVLLQHQHLEAAPRKMKRRRAAVNAAADDDDVRLRHQPRSTALAASSVCGREASSARVIGFTGGRRR
jgi:hypothetical protein